MAQNKLIVAFFLLSILLLPHQTQSRKFKFNNKNAGMNNNCLSAMPCTNEAAITPPPPPPPPTAVATSQPPPPGHADDFRPTAPGHSPGIGHSLWITTPIHFLLICYNYVLTFMHVCIVCSDIYYVLLIKHFIVTVYSHSLLVEISFHHLIYRSFAQINIVTLTNGPNCSNTTLNIKTNITKCTNSGFWLWN